MRMQPRSTIAKLARSVNSHKTDLLVLLALTMCVMCAYFTIPGVYRTVYPPQPSQPKQKPKVEIPLVEQSAPYQWSTSPPSAAPSRPLDSQDRLISAGVKNEELKEVLLTPQDFIVPSRPFRTEFEGVTHPFNMSVGKPCSEKVKLLVMVPSRPEAFDTRTAIRETWAKDLPSDITVRFVIGAPEEVDIVDMLMGEQKKHADLVLNSIADNYTNLYLKINAALQWQQAYCPLAQHVLKTDDDTVVDLKRLQHWIGKKFANASHGKPSVFGGMWKGAKPNRDPAHKWYVSSDVFPESVFPTYLNGPTYLLSSDAVTLILKHCKEVKPFAIEDILYTGVLARKAGVVKGNAWNYFREGSRVELKEACADGIPYVTAIYGIEPTFFAQTYERLRTARCA